MLMRGFAEALLKSDEFLITCELVPGRGHSGVSVENIQRFVDGVKEFLGVHALSLTDNAGGNPALSADVLGAEIVHQGIDIIVHFSCKDMNRNFIESRAYALQRSGVTNLLVVSGDYPSEGYLGLAKPVFDIDSVTAIYYLSRMNAGLPAVTARGTTRLAPTRFLLGAVVSPFKWTEAGCVMQYFKLEKKIRAGAHFVVTQLGFDSRKLVELRQHVRHELRSAIPLIGSVCVLGAGAAEVMHRGEVPGCYVSDGLLRQVREEAKADDKGKAARLERAARQVAILKGLGYRGAHLEGLNLKLEDVRAILARSAELEPRWESLLADFAFAPSRPYYYYEQGERIGPAGEPKRLRPRQTPRRRIASARFWLGRAIHKLFFVEGTAGYRMMVRVCGYADQRERVSAALARVEHFTKRTFFSCRYCDDCALMDTFYVCPEARCPKAMRTGPCGGSRVDGKCEVYANRDCVWSLIYWRAKNRGESEKLHYLMPPRNWKLCERGSWVNYFLKRDHSAHPLPLPK